jgi:hypothetical protein
MTTDNAGRHDVWYFTTETMIDGERRGFSLQTRARPDRTRKVPTIVDTRCLAFLADVIDGSDLCDYSSVERGERCDWPYRTASYVLTCNGLEVVRSLAIRPIRPEVTS